MAAVNNVTIDELKKVKFQVIQDFGFCGTNKFFIYDSDEPKGYGYDCRNLRWHEVIINSKKDLIELAAFIKFLFGVEINASGKRNAKKSINALIDYLKTISPVKDWGACTVQYIPFNPAAATAKK